MAYVSNPGGTPVITYEKGDRTFTVITGGTAAAPTVLPRYSAHDIFLVQLASGQTTGYVQLRATGTSPIPGDVVEVLGYAAAGGGDIPVDVTAGPGGGTISNQSAHAVGKAMRFMAVNSSYSFGWWLMGDSQQF